ncbi:hypothetical protein BOTBODRAFT_369972 [Botryobasidium botryosum FD-172 SS1]|uniref:Uncharacterized protein n=1 Tax=Botryobasidium botryosum (strain FD-172 SS1) TaxID=930990 RepID=A0A067MNQ6_BOTB1|nr:hypothetical protein BOTBODRAFT_369972 [Botryobasidium botryosum FD-172 SS1]
MKFMCHHTGWMSAKLDGKNSTEKLPIARRYLDANRNTYQYHTTESPFFDTPRGQKVTAGITALAGRFNLSYVFGTAPQDYYLNRAQYPSNYSVLSLLVEKDHSGLTYSRVHLREMINLSCLHLTINSFIFLFPSQLVNTSSPNSMRLVLVDDRWKMQSYTLRAMSTTALPVGNKLSGSSLRTWLRQPTSHWAT